MINVIYQKRAGHSSVDLFQRGFQERSERTEKSRDTLRSHFNWPRIQGLSQSGILSCLLPCGRGSNLIANKQTSLRRLHSILSNRPFPEQSVQGRAFRLRSRQLSETLRAYISLHTNVSSFLSILHVYAHLRPCRFRSVSKTVSSPTYVTYLYDLRN